MSAPQTNLEVQKRRHIVPLIGIAAAALFGVLILVYWLYEEVEQADPQPAGETIETPATTSPPAVTEPAPTADPGTQPTPLAPEPAPQGGENPTDAPVTPQTTP